MLLWEIGVTWFSQGNLALARDSMDRAEQVLEDAGIISSIVWAKIKFQQSYAFLREGNYKETKKTANEALEMFSDISKIQPLLEEDKTYLSLAKRTLVRSSVDIGKIYTILSTMEAALGHFGETLLCLNKALAIAEQNNSLREMAIISCNMGDLYLRMADYSQAQAALRRSRNLAQLIGDKPIEAVILCNMGVIDIRTGNIIEASGEIEGAIAIFREIKDPASNCEFYTNLAFSLAEQGKITEARKAIFNALMYGRSTKALPYISFSLIIMGYLRLLQYKSIKLDGNEQDSGKKKDLLERAQKTLLHALNFEAIEANTRIEGFLILAQVMLQLEDFERAHQYSILALEEAQQINLHWLIARSHHVLGNVYAMRYDFEHAIGYYEQSLRVLHRNGMRLEYARLLVHYGSALLFRTPLASKEYQIGMGYLQEARQIFKDCNAELDLREVELEFSGQETIHK